VSDEIEPFILYRLTAGQVECAIPKLTDGSQALAVFLTSESAVVYQKVAGLGKEWTVFRPSKEALLQLLKACHEAGVAYAVLDPDEKQAKRVFDLQQVIRQAESGGSE